MSHRALIAERQRNDRFNIYSSQNGAENIQLLDELRDSLNVHGRVDWEELNGTTTPAIAQQFTESPGSEYGFETTDTGNVVEPRPTAVNVPEHELLAGNDLLEYEVLYVVDNGDVEAYWLAWTYADVIRPWADHIEVDVYRSRRVPTDAERLQKFVDEAEPLRTISEFNPGWLADGTVRRIARDYHRYLYELQSLTRQKAKESGDGYLSKVLPLPESTLVFRADGHEPLVPPSGRFTVPIRIESPANASSMRIQQSVAETRFNIGAELNAAENVTRDRVLQACSESLSEVVDEYIERVASEFLPERLQRAVEEHRETETSP
ncbi:DUF6735 family protein [Halorubellus salinus]|uniref:DUF6735 family protein n=1 Tax=Halorubellus salinus TaxID=755309 RepID=UPI001D0910DB|nr:DUF6735 family protein [Halorubellus salinus]